MTPFTKLTLFAATTALLNLTTSEEISGADNPPPGGAIALDADGNARDDDPATANAVQLAELQLSEPKGTLLREVWTGISGTAVTDLTGNANFPNNPSSSDQLSSFEAPITLEGCTALSVETRINRPAFISTAFSISSIFRHAISFMIEVM